MDRSELPQRQQPWGGIVPSVHSLIHRHTDAYMQKYGDRVCPHVQSTLLRMHYCRSSDLGKRVFRCDPCGYETTVFNSCGDRNCPQCSGARRSDWLDSTLKLTTPQATYFQVVFTLPDQLSSLALGNRTVMYNLLFETAWDVLRARIEKGLGIQAAAVAVLHTWNQRLGHHPHVHMMVPGNGPSLDGKRWVECRMEWCRKTRSKKPFLVDNKQLGWEFRNLFLNRLTQLVEQGKIELEDSCYIADLLGDLRLQDWVVFIEGPPKPDCLPSVMLKYLTRYLTGGPISDRRIVGEKDGRVYFMARSKRKSEGQVMTSLPRVEFVQQWCLHIVPKDFTKTRFFGAWSGSKRRKYTAQCQELSPPPASPPPHASSTIKHPTCETPTGQRACPHCNCPMTCIAQADRPSWRDLFYGPAHPAWYEWTSLGKYSPPDEPPDQQADEQQTSLSSSLGPPLFNPSAIVPCASPVALELDIFDEIIVRNQQERRE